MSEHNEPNELHNFMHENAVWLQASYERIQKRVRSDPGTAGDEGEEAWAKILRDWLPATYHVRTKGRILFTEGQPSRQIDVIVLDPNYPRGLADTKMYLAAGVVAAFECKITLRKHHVFEAADTARLIKSRVPPKSPTTYDELWSPIYYGLLAHSHDWKGNKATPVQNIYDYLEQILFDDKAHPRSLIDCICISDVATWSVIKSPWLDKSWRTGAHSVSLDDARITAGYERHGYSQSVLGFLYTPEYQHSNPLEYRQRLAAVDRTPPVSSLLTSIWTKLARKDATLRDYVAYMETVQLKPGGSAKLQTWPTTLYSEALRKKLDDLDLTPEQAFQRWAEVV